MKIKPLLLTFAFLTTLASADTEWKIFNSASGGKQFVGRLLSYNPKGELVTVQKKSTMRTVTFKLDLLSEEDRKDVKSRAMELRAAGSLRMSFREKVEKISTTRKGAERNSNYNGGFEIYLQNFSPDLIEDVEVDYIIVYRKDAVDGLGEEATLKGTRRISTLVPNVDETIVADGVPLKSYYKSGSVSGRGGAGCST